MAEFREPGVAAAHAAWRERAREALAEAAAELLALASADAPYNPNVPGEHLRDSGHIEFREAPGALIAEVIFDGPYAAKQHEHREYKHPHGGQAKYLERNLISTRFLEQLGEKERNLLI